MHRMLHRASWLAWGCRCMLDAHPPLLCCRCRAWEQGTPLASLFRRYEADLQRLAAERGQLEEESCQLARLLAAADLERLAGGDGTALKLDGLVDLFLRCKAHESGMWRWSMYFSA